MKKYICENCNFSTNNIVCLERHNKTKKHQKYLTTPMEMTFLCNICKKKYNSRNGLKSHQKTCSPPQNITSSIEDTQATIKELLEIKNLVIDLKNEQKPNQINTNNTQNNFNINVILNENNIKPTISFIEMLTNIKIDKSYKRNIEENGYVNTLGDLIKITIDGIPIMERPIHCIKDEIEHQEVLHIHNNNEWKREMELEWTKEIYDFYNGEKDIQDNDKKHIFYGLVKMEEQIFEQVKGMYANSFQFLRFQRDVEGELNFTPNKIKIIENLLHHIKQEKTEFSERINSFLEEQYTMEPTL